jgi:endonuclease III
LPKSSTTDSTGVSKSAEEITTIVKHLENRYGMAQWTAGSDPVDELVGCILSQHTSDINSGRAFRDLKQAYPEWQQVVEVPAEALAKVIWRGGLSNIKAPRIQTVLSRLKQDHGDYSLDALYAMTDTEARAYLMSLPGVGPKTAAIVLCFAMGRNVMPVDTHIFRVSWRLGLIEKKIGEARAHDALQAMVPPELTYRYHVALITHGRQVCRAIGPKCSECLVAEYCGWYASEHRKDDTNRTSNG